MQKRKFGNSDISLSPLTFGSMRLDSKKISLEGAENLLRILIEGGVTTFHSSHEYETHSFFCTVLQRFTRQNRHLKLQHIAKIGVPHFNEGKFDGRNLRRIVESQIKMLNTDRLDVVQWLVRQTPNEDDRRLAVFREGIPDLLKTWDDLKKEGKVGILTSFPYSAVFAKEVLNFELCKGLVTYLNPAELECVEYLEPMESMGQGYVAIRPLWGGQILGASGSPQTQKLSLAFKRLGLQEEEIVPFCLSFPLLHPAVASVMLSISSENHARQALRIVDKARDNKAEFYKVVAEIRNT